MRGYPRRTSLEYHWTGLVIRMRARKHDLLAVAMSVAAVLAALVAVVLLLP